MIVTISFVAYLVMSLLMLSLPDLTRRETCLASCCPRTSGRARRDGWRFADFGYSSTCPGVFNFAAAITANGAGTATYRWERSDGATSQTQSLAFTAAGSQTVTTSWTLSANGSFWERIHVLTPNDLLSNQSTFSNSCR